MPHCSNLILIAAADSRLQSFSRGFGQHRAQFDSGDVILFLAGLAAVFGILWLVARWSERHVRSDSSLGLFWTLCKTHEITWHDRWLLWRIARAKGVSEPSLLFLDPRLTSPQFMNHLAPQPAARLKALRRRFFFGIDRIAEPLAEGSPIDPGGGEEQLALPDAAASVSPMPTSWPPPEPTPLSPTGDLAEMFGAIQALKLQEQLAPRRTDSEVSRTDATEETAPETAPSADFPATGTPILDLYPWLGSDWEITEEE